MKEIKESNTKYLINIIAGMKEREITKKNLLIIQQLEFEAEISMMKGEKSNVEEKFRDFLKTLKQKQPILLPSPEIKEKTQRHLEGDKENKMMREINLPPKMEKTRESLGIAETNLSTKSISLHDNKKQKARNRKLNVNS